MTAALHPADHGIMTAMEINPKGRVFISYRRCPKRKLGNLEADRLQAALNDRGVPTWRDIEDLDTEPLDPELRDVIRDSDTSGAVLLVTPEVRSSETIREVEVPELFSRHSSCEDFFVIPALIGVDYKEANSVLGIGDGGPDLGSWHLLKVDGDELSDVSAAEVADKVLRRRVRII